MSKTENIEIDDAVVDAIAKKATEQLRDSIQVPTAEDIAKQFVELTEKTEKKNVTGSPVVTAVNKMDEMSKEQRFARGLVAFKTKDHAGIQEYNSYVDKKWQEVNKANYQNVTTTADGGALVPDPEFVAEVERLTSEYGVAARLATIRTTDRDSVTLLSGTNEFSFTSTSEATAQNAQKLTYGAATVALNKYIGTLIMTSEVIEDAAINLWQDATNEIARGRAKLLDQLVFTDSTYGLLSAAVADAYKTQTIGAAITNLDADDLMNARYKVVSSARQNGRYFMHPSVWNFLRQQKADNASYGSLNYLFGGPGQTVAPNVDGVPVELVDVLPEFGDITANEAFAVFGDLSRVKIHIKRLLETKIFDSGVVPDAGGTDINLISQDAWAIRATTRLVPQTRFEGAFTIIGTGTVS